MVRLQRRALFPGEEIYTVVIYTFDWNFILALCIIDVKERRWLQRRGNSLLGGTDLKTLWVLFGKPGVTFYVRYY